MSLVEGFKRARIRRYFAKGQVPPPWVGDARRTEVAMARASLSAAHPLRELVAMGVLPVSKAVAMLKHARGAA